MGQKYHIGQDGTPKPCNAKQNCPLTGQSSHGTKEEVQKLCNILNEAIYDMPIEKLTKKAETDTPENDIYRTALYKRQQDKPVEFKNIKDIKLKDFAEPDSGLSLNLNDNSVADRGFMVSVYPERSLVIEPGLDEKQFEKVLNDYIEQNSDLLYKQGNILGFWKSDGPDGNLYLDVSTVVEDASLARELGQNKDQIAYFDPQTFTSITIDENATSGQAA